MEVGHEVIASMAAAVNSPTGSIKVGPVWGVSGASYYSAQVYDGRKKVGPFIVNSADYPASPAGALRSLADLLEMPLDRD